MKFTRFVTRCLPLKAGQRHERRRQTRLPGFGMSFPASNEFCPVCALRAALKPDRTSTELTVSSISDLHLGHYEILTHEDGTAYELGRGAMGITYKAFDVDLRRLAALKVNQPALSSR